MKKLLVDDKITACVKEICLLDVVCKISNRKTLSGETFCLPEKSVYNMRASEPASHASEHASHASHASHQGSHASQHKITLFLT